MKTKQIEHISFKDCRTIKIDSNNWAPVVYEGRYLIFSIRGLIKRGNLVLCKPKNHELTLRRYFPTKDQVILDQINPVQQPLIVNKKDIELIYRVTGINMHLN